MLEMEYSRFEGQYIAVDTLDPQVTRAPAGMFLTAKDRQYVL